MEREHVILELDGHEVRFSNPDKVFFPVHGHTKMDLLEYYLAVADPLLGHRRDRRTSMKRFPNGADDDYSVRPVPDAHVSAPLEGDEVPDAEMGDFRLDSVPERLLQKGDPSAGLHETAGSLEPLLDLAAHDEAGGLGDAPWPPHFAKQRGEPKRVQPSRAKRTDVDLRDSRSSLG
jgi:DNA primase